MNASSAKPLDPQEATPPTVAAELPIRYGAANVVAGQLADEMSRAWKQGRRIVVEELLEHHPELRQQRDAVLRLVCEESYLRRQSGLPLDVEEWKLRFPEWRQDVAALLECQKLLDPEAETEAPRPLGRLHEFQLLAVLGRGGQGQVYLATQPQLADRPVVVKVTECRGREHLSLARLQHTHIVPLYWAQDHADENQRILCMPYFGSVTLAMLQASLQGVPMAERVGKDILDVLDRMQPPVLPPAIPRGPARQLLACFTYAQAMAWMGMCLADALHYAHQRDLLHLDIKPSNVLWSIDGQPMLLDFHLARAPIRPGGPPVRGLGGTPTYMAPEQEIALQEVSQRKPVTQIVDGRADVFSLGLLLYQALGGPFPCSLDQPARLDQINPQVSPGLADIIARCLARHADSRYPSAESLAADLRRHLENRALAGVANRSWSERWTKWRRRKPYALRVYGWVTALVVVATLAVGWSIRQRIDEAQRDEHVRQEARERLVQAQTALARAKSHLRDGNFELALATLENGKALLPDAPEAGDLSDAYAQERQTALQLRGRNALHEGVDALRGAVVAESLTLRQLDMIDSKCRELWKHRAWILPAASGDPRTRQDLIDLGIIWSEVRLRQSSAEDLVSVRQGMLDVLREIEERCGSSPLLAQVIASHLQALGKTAEARRQAALLNLNTRLTAWEHVARARACLEEGRDAATYAGSLVQGAFALDSRERLARSWTASAPFRIQLASWHAREAIAQEPDLYWAHFYEGAAAYRQDRPEAALAAFQVCLALAPRQPIAHYNHGLAAAKADNLTQALADYTRALELAPDFADAALNRALIHARLHEYAAAEADLRLARAKGAEAALVQRNLELVARLKKSPR